jgi:CDP-glucose 4,6-dehydratase
MFSLTKTSFNFILEITHLPYGKDYCLFMDLLLCKRLKALKGPILVTGHTGFKGTWLTILLEELGVSVVGFSLPPLEGSLYLRLARTDKIPEIYGDIRNMASVKEVFSSFKPSAVIHMAAQPLVIKSYETPIETFETNVMGTVNILDAAINNKCVKGVVAVTTDKVYRNHEEEIRFLESDPLAGRDPYSASKVGAEAAIAAWQQISRNIGGPQVVSARAGNVIGGGDWSENRLMPDLMKGFSTGQRVEIRNPKSTRPWQHALDPLYGYLKTLNAILTNESSNAYNFGPIEKSLSVDEVVKLAKDCWKNPLEVDVHLNELSSNSEAKSLDLDPSLAIKELNWHPAWNQTEAIINTVTWWRDLMSSDSSAFDLCQRDIKEFMVKTAEFN